MEWIELKTQKNIDNFMNSFYGFHDSCIKECSYITGMFVDKNKKSIKQDIHSSNMKIVFESQWCNSIEIYFEGIKEINIYTYDNDKYFNNISDAKFLIEDNLIYWANSSEWNKDNNDKEITYVICNSAKYRSIKNGEL